MLRSAKPIPGGWWAVFFFFSSRRRHTRLVSDWSSDVCSSDLLGDLLGARAREQLVELLGPRGLRGGRHLERAHGLVDLVGVGGLALGELHDAVEIGRASCRERG